MAYSQEAFRRVYISNPEGTPGTAEAATEILFGKLKIPLQSEIHHTPEQDRNSLAEIVELPFLVAKDVEFEFEADLYDRLMLFLAASSIRGNVTGVSAGGMKPLEIIHTYEPGLTTSNTPDIANGIDTFTIEFGDNVQAYEAEFCFSMKVVIEAELGADEDAVVTCTWSIGGRQVSTTTFTGALTEPSAAYFPANLVKLFIDTSYAGMGGTEKTGVLRAFKWTFEPMFTKRFAAGGGYVFSALNEAKKAPELELTFYRDSTIVEAELVKYKATPKTKTFIRIALTSGSPEMDSGQSNPPYIWLDGAYVYTEFPELEEEDSTGVVTVTARGVKDATSGKMMSVIIGTLMAAFA